MALSKTARKTLEKIRARVERTDWIKGHYSQPSADKDRYCLVGLINDTLGEDPSTFVGRGLLEGTPKGNFFMPLDERERSRKKAQKAAVIANVIFAAIKKRHPKTQASTIEDWNDRKSTKREDVLAVLDEALKEE